jgi:hypothetical protein
MIGRLCNQRGEIMSAPTRSARLAVLLPTLLLLTAIALAQEGGEEQAPEPPSAGELVYEAYTAEGIDAAVAKFRELMADESGEHAFWESDFTGIGISRMLWRGKRDDAIRFMPLVVERFPDSSRAWFGLGSAHLAFGEKDEAVKCIRKAAELDPASTHLEWMLGHIDELIDAAKRNYEGVGRFEPGEVMPISGPYLGQEPPGKAPKPFAPGIIGSPVNEFSITFSPDGREIYFSRSREGVLMCRWMDDGWTAPKPIPLNPEGFADEPSVAPDGRHILFNFRNLAKGQRERTIHIAAREGEGWGEHKALFVGMYPTQTRRGTIYYTIITGRPDYGVIGRVHPTEDGGYSGPELIDGGVNTPSLDGHPFIDPDERFIIFDSNRGGSGPMYNCLYICFRNDDDTWGDAICLHDHLDIPRFVGQSCLSPDGRYLFYSFNGDMYWVSAEGLMDLREE